MAGWLRRAGAGETPDGDHVVWSVAEGRRGRRWREVVTGADGRSIRSSLLLELDPDGRFSHLELATAAGLLTLHPEGDRTLHGNAITADGIEHIVGRPWDRDAVILLEGSVVCATVAAGVRGGEPASALRISLRLDLTSGRSGPAIARSPDGLPKLVAGRSWPLEEAD